MAPTICAWLIPERRRPSCRTDGGSEAVCFKSLQISIIALSTLNSITVQLKLLNAWRILFFSHPSYTRMLNLCYWMHSEDDVNLITNIRLQWPITSFWSWYRWTKLMKLRFYCISRLSIRITTKFYAHVFKVGQHGETMSRSCVCYIGGDRRLVLGRQSRTKARRRRKHFFDPHIDVREFSARAGSMSVF